MLNINNPDYEIELFWLSFKKSMNNFYSKTFASRPIEYWCNQLNYLQKEKNYDKIQEKIKNYISLYAIDILKCSSRYNIDILITNIKRWNKISLKYNFNDNKKYENIIFLLLDIFSIIYELDISKCKIIYSQIELLIIYEDLNDLIKFAIKHQKPSLLDKINKYNNINEIINKIYNLNIDNNISGKKILQMIKI